MKLIILPILQRLRQEKLGLLLKCFTELSAILQLLRGSDYEAAEELMATCVQSMNINIGQINKNLDVSPSASQQKILKLNTAHIAAKVVEQTEQTVEDDISKFTGRLERVFDTSRNKRRDEVQETQDDVEPLQESDSKLNQLSVPSPKFALHESKSQSSPSS